MREVWIFSGTTQYCINVIKHHPQLLALYIDYKCTVVLLLLSLKYVTQDFAWACLNSSCNFLYITQKELRESDTPRSLCLTKHQQL